MNPVRLVCVHSLTAHGVVGLKAFVPVLGELCLAVPSVLLSGPGDMPGCERFNYDAAGLLRSTLRASAAKQERVVVFVGYMASAEQITAISEILNEQRETISALCVDPVCGDDGRAYVSAPIIAAWPALLARADWMFPNLTEAELLTGARGESAVTALAQLNPRARLVVTGWSVGTEIETRLYGPTLEATHGQLRIGGRFNGAGDLFAAYFMRSVFVEGAPPGIALGIAAEGVGRAIQLAVARGERDLSVRTTI